MTAWGSAAWVTEVEAWIGAVTGSAVTVAHRETRPWSTLWTAPTEAGTLWLRRAPQRGPGPRGGAALAPDHVDAPVAVEPGRGWLLTRDGGTRLMDAAPGGTRGVEVPALTGLLRDYAALQRLTLGHRDRLVRAGLRVAHPIDAPS